MKKKCIGCGKEFTPWPGFEEAQSYCTVECMEKYDPVKIYHHICKCCGCSFDSYEMKGQYCCKRCRDKAAYERMMERRRLGIYASKEKTCEICGKKFMSSNSMAKACSPECRLILRRKNDLARKKKYYQIKKAQRHGKC